MGEYPNEMCVEHTKDIATLKEKVDSLENKVDDCSTIKDALIELKMVTKEQANYNKKFNEMYEKSLISNIEFSNTLKSINENLNSLNNEVKEAKGEIKGTNERIDDLEEKFEKENDKFLIDTREIQKESTLNWIKQNKGKVAVTSVISGSALFTLIEFIKFIITNVDNFKKLTGI
jgi:chromosome segregation ATPase